MDSTPLLIAFGSNIDPLHNLFQGLTQLHRELGLCAISTVYRTAPLPNPNHPESAPVGPHFLNGSVLSKSQCNPNQLRQLLRKIEARQRRVRTTNPYDPRTLDLDIAMMGNRVLHKAPFILPDPDIIKRPFLAIPLAELCPDTIHPLEKTTLKEIASRFRPQPDQMRADPKVTALLQAITHRCNSL